MELPALAEWKLDASRASAITQPVLYVIGGESAPLFEEGRLLLHSWLPQTEDFAVPGATHLLQMQDPQTVARGIADFLKRHSG